MNDEMICIRSILKKTQKRVNFQFLSQLINFIHSRAEGDYRLDELVSVCWSSRVNNDTSNTRYSRTRTKTKISTSIQRN